MYSFFLPIYLSADVSQVLHKLYLLVNTSSNDHIIITLYDIYKGGGAKCITFSYTLVCK